jgi:hypothetical protein
VFANNKSRAEADDQCRVINRRVQWCLGKTSVDHHFIRAQRKSRSDQHRNDSVRGRREADRILERFHSAANQTFDRNLASSERARQRHGTANSERFGQLECEHAKATSHQSPRHPRGQITCPAENDWTGQLLHVDEPTRRAATTAAMTDTAISSGVSAPISRPIGVCTRSRSATDTPAARSCERVTSHRRRLPIRPT